MEYFELQSCFFKAGIICDILRHPHYCYSFSAFIQPVWHQLALLFKKVLSLFVLESMATFLGYWAHLLIYSSCFVALILCSAFCCPGQRSDRNRQGSCGLVIQNHTALSLPVLGTCKEMDI